MAIVLTKEENDVYVDLLNEGGDLTFGEYLQFEKIAPLFKGYDNLEEILKKLDAENLIISKGAPENKFDMVRAVSYPDNKVIIRGS